MPVLESLISLVSVIRVIRGQLPQQACRSMPVPDPIDIRRQGKRIGLTGEARDAMGIVRHSIS